VTKDMSMENDPVLSFELSEYFGYFSLKPYNRLVNRTRKYVIRDKVIQQQCALPTYDILDHVDFV